MLELWRVRMRGCAFIISYIPHGRTVSNFPAA